MNGITDAVSEVFDDAFVFLRNNPLVLMLMIGIGTLWFMIRSRNQHAPVIIHPPQHMPDAVRRLDPRGEAALLLPPGQRRQEQINREWLREQENLEWAIRASQASQVMERTPAGIVSERNEQSAVDELNSVLRREQHDKLLSVENNKTREIRLCDVPLFDVETLLDKMAEFANVHANIDLLFLRNVMISFADKGAFDRLVGILRDCGYEVIKHQCMGIMQDDEMFLTLIARKHGVALEFDLSEEMHSDIYEETAFAALGHKREKENVVEEPLNEEGDETDVLSEQQKDEVQSQILTPPEVETEILSIEELRRKRLAVLEANKS